MVKISTNIIVLIIAGLIVAVVLIAWVFPIISRHMFSFELPTQGPKARFLRYLTCALAMCSHGYNTQQTIGIVLEYDEKGNPIKGCNSYIKEIGEELGETFVTGQKLCGERYALNFTFRENITYIGNYSVERGKTGTPCGLVTTNEKKLGFQTDVSCMAGWEETGILACGCLGCMQVGRYSANVRPPGKLAKHTGDCGRGDTYHSGTIWIPESMVTSGKCIEGDIPYLSDGLAWCEFEINNSYYIWAEDAHHSNYNCFWFIFEGCIGGLLAGNPNHICPQLIICDHAP